VARHGARGGEVKVPIAALARDAKTDLLFVGDRSPLRPPLALPDGRGHVLERQFGDRGVVPLTRSGGVEYLHPFRPLTSGRGGDACGVRRRDHGPSLPHEQPPARRFAAVRSLVFRAEVCLRLLTSPPAPHNAPGTTGIRAATPAGLYRDDGRRRRSEI